MLPSALSFGFKPFAVSHASGMPSPSVSVSGVPLASLGNPTLPSE